MKYSMYNGFASEEEYEQVLAIAYEIIGEYADEVSVSYDEGVISVKTEYGRYIVVLGQGVVHICVADSCLDSLGLMVYEGLNHNAEKLYGALNEEDEV